MDWQDSGASPLKPLTDDELAAALAGLSTEAAMKLLEEQAELRKRQAELDAVVKQRDALLSQQQTVEESAVVEETPVETQAPQPSAQSQAPIQNHGDFTLDLGFIEEVEPIQSIPLPGTESKPTAHAEPEDIAASLNALYGAAGVPDQSASVEELVTEVEESKNVNLVDDLILQFGGEEETAQESAKKTSREKAEGRSAWSLIANWNGSGAIAIAMLMGYLFAGTGQALGSLVAGGFVAFVVLGLIFAFSALAARRGNAFQQVLARSAFGVTGNIIPTVVLLFARLLGVAVAIVFGALTIVDLLPFFQLSGNLSLNLAGTAVTLPLAILLAAGLTLVVTLLALVRGKTIAVSRVVIAFVSLGLVAAIVVIAELQQKTAYRADLSVDLLQALAFASSLTVVFGLFFAITSGDENRQIRPTTIIPKFIAAGILNWTIAGTAALVGGYVLASLDLTSMNLLPISLGVSILGTLALATILAQTANQLVGLRAPEPKLLVRLAVSLVGLGLGSWIYLSFDSQATWQSLWQFLPVAGTPVAAWLGIFTADVMLRRTDYHLVSLDKNYGFYRGWNLVNLFGWAVATTVGLGFVQSEAQWLTWAGYLAGFVGNFGLLAEANVGVWLSLLLGLLTPLCFGIPRIRKQEAETIAIEARRKELAEVLEEPEL